MQNINHATMVEKSLEMMRFLFFLICLPFTWQCSLWLAPSKIPFAGFGIYAGKNFRSESILGLSHSIIVDSYIIEDLKLMGYVFTPNYEDQQYYSLLLFGPALMFNHMNSKSSNTKIYWHSDIDSTSQHVPLRPYTIYPSLSFQAIREIRGGEELTFTYGDKSYFEERNASIDFGPIPEGNKNYLYSELQLSGHCLTDIVVGPSTIPLAGKGVFSRKSYDTGALVSISPVLAVPKHAVTRGGRGSVLLNYLISVNDSDIGLLPIGTAGMINHGRSDQVNIKLHWYGWKGRDVMTLLETMDVDKELIGVKSAQLYLGYSATRPIEAGEELLMSYGSDWERSWQTYLKLMEKVWSNMENKTQGQFDGDQLLSAPQFRHHIELPRQLLPKKWTLSTTRCISSRDCNPPYDVRRPDLVQSRFNRRQIFNFDRKSLITAQTHWNSCDDDNTCSSPLTTTQTKKTKLELVDDSQCALYLHPIDIDSPKSPLGVFSGTIFSPNDAIDLSDTLLFHSNLMKLPNLKSYSTSAVHKNFATFIMGIGSIIRRSSTMSNTERVLNARDKLIHVPYPQIQSLRPYSLQTEMLFITRKSLQAGEEITILDEHTSSSSSSQQGSKRGNTGKKHLNQPKSIPIEKLRSSGHCLSHIFVNISDIPLAGKGVFTNRAFQTGQLVSISPVLVVPKHLFVEDESSVLLNYLISVTDSDIGLLPIGTAGMMNHGRSDQVNIKLHWYDWKGRDVMTLLETMDVEKELIGVKSAQLYLGYSATRPIEAGEELLMSYGSDWERAWQTYLKLMEIWVDSQKLIDVNEVGKTIDNFHGDQFMHGPQFRHPILLPSSLTPSSFQNQSFQICLDQELFRDCHGKGLKLRPEAIHHHLNNNRSTRFDYEMIQMAMNGTRLVYQKELTLLDQIMKWFS